MKFFVSGFIWEEAHEIYTLSLKDYLRNLWNFIDFTRNFLYSMVFILRVVAYVQQAAEIRNDETTASIPREEWNAFDPQLVAEGLFAAANIFRYEIDGMVFFKSYNFLFVNNSITITLTGNSKKYLMYGSFV